MNKRQHKKRTKNHKRNAEVQAAINSAIIAAQTSYLNCSKQQNQHYKDILKGFIDVKNAQQDVLDYILDRQENHYKETWKNMLNAINRANQREKDLNYMIFGYVILTIATIILMLTH